jgi:DNA mismatch repair ATPase MutS
MAIAYAVLNQLVSSTQCKTLFITHYPLVALELEKKFVGRLQNIHVGYHTEKRAIDGRREVTFLYRLTNGIAPGQNRHCNVSGSENDHSFFRVIWSRVCSPGRIA